MEGSTAYTLFAAADTRLVKHAAACKGRDCGGHCALRGMCCGRGDGGSQAAAPVRTVLMLLIVGILCHHKAQGARGYRSFVVRSRLQSLLSKLYKRW